MVLTTPGLGPGASLIVKRTDGLNADAVSLPGVYWYTNSQGVLT